MWPLMLLLLLCGLSDSTAVKGPREVAGRAGGSLVVTCQYDARYKWDQKWWCHGMVGSGCSYRVETTGAEPVVRKDRVSIRDDKSQSRFTVTIERLRDHDAGTYWCGIQTTKLDLNFSITVTINPAPTTTTIFTTTTTTPSAPTTMAITEETTDTLRVTSALSNTTGFPVLLILPVISAVLPLLLAAALLAWRKLKRQRTATGVHPEPDAQEEVSYAHLSLHPHDLEPTYTKVDPRASPRPGRSPEVDTEYSSIRKPRAGL